MEVDPYKLLGVPRNFTLEQLKQSYKQLMLKHHPDKNFDLSSPIASLLTSAYKKLVEDYAYRISNKEFSQLREESRTHIDKSQQQAAAARSSSPSRFNLNKFNELFEQNKEKDAGYDDGYDKWMKTEKSFNQSNDRNWSVVKRVEPQPLFGGKILSNAYELGVSEVKDFSGDNTSSKNLGYMDYRIAHTTGKIIDESLVKQRRNYKNVQDLEKERGKISFVMPETERARYEREQAQEQDREIRRRKIQEVKDFRSAQAYQRAQFALANMR